jgi:hypothetical protein
MQQSGNPSVGELKRETEQTRALERRRIVTLVCTENLNPSVVVMKSAQDGA